MQHYEQTALFVSFLLTVVSCASVATTIIRRTSSGDEYAHINSSSVQKCKKYLTLASNQNNETKCMSYRDISNCTYGYNEYDSSGTPIIISKHSCNHDVIKVDVWDVINGTGFWRKLHVSDRLHKGDIFIKFMQNRNVTWEGLLIRIWLQCENHVGCTLVKVYGTTNHPLPEGGAVLNRRKITTIETFMKSKKLAIQKKNLTENERKNRMPRRTNYHVTFLNILYYVMLTMLGIFVLVMIWMTFKKKKQKFYSISIDSRNSAGHYRYSESFARNSRFSESFDMQRSFQHNSLHEENTYGNEMLLKQ